MKKQNTKYRTPRPTFYTLWRWSWRSLLFQPKTFCFARRKYSVCAPCLCVTDARLWNKNILFLPHKCRSDQGLSIGRIGHGLFSYRPVANLHVLGKGAGRREFSVPRKQSTAIGKLVSHQRGHSFTFMHSFIHSFIHSFLPSFLFIPLPSSSFLFLPLPSSSFLFLPLPSPSFLPSFIHSFIHSFIRLAHCDAWAAKTNGVINVPENKK